MGFREEYTPVVAVGVDCVDELHHHELLSSLHVLEIPELKSDPTGSKKFMWRAVKNYDELWDYEKPVDV